MTTTPQGPSTPPKRPRGELASSQQAPPRSEICLGTDGKASECRLSSSILRQRVPKLALRRQVRPVFAGVLHRNKTGRRIGPIGPRRAGRRPDNAATHTFFQVTAACPRIHLNARISPKKRESHERYGDHGGKCFDLHRNAFQARSDEWESPYRAIDSSLRLGARAGVRSPCTSSTLRLGRPQVL